MPERGCQADRIRAWGFLEDHLPPKMFVTMIERSFMLVPIMVEPRSDAHYGRRRPISGHPDALGSIVAIHPRISGTGTNRPNHSHGSAEPDSNRHSRRREQAAGEEHHQKHCLFHFL
jgi:hypothetical protein